MSGWRIRLTHWLESVWYGSRPFERSLLYPFSLLFKQIARRRRIRHTREQTVFPVPIIVVGNISVGGTGKTPLVVWLVEHLRAVGYRPGVVSRGFGGKTLTPTPLPEVEGLRKSTASSSPSTSGRGGRGVRVFGVREVLPTDSATEVGDEPLLIVQRTGVPMVIGRQRVQAVEYLLQQHPCDVVISDDGLQHYRMGRALEIVVLDGERRFGNGLCLPAGPLREPPERLRECDFVVVNGNAQAGEFGMHVRGDHLWHVRDGHREPLSDWAVRSVRVVTAIGNPARFFALLEQAGIRYQADIYPDHHLFAREEICFSDGIPVLMTEKDAVKCRQFPASDLANVWCLPVEARLDQEFESALLQRLKGLQTNG